MVHIVSWLGRRVVAATTQVRLLACLACWVWKVITNQSAKCQFTRCEIPCALNDYIAWQWAMRWRLGRVTSTSRDAFLD